MRSTIFSRQSCYFRSSRINDEWIVGSCDSPRGLLSPEIHTFCRTKDQWAPARCHSRLKREGGGHEGESSQLQQRTTFINTVIMKPHQTCPHLITSLQIRHHPHFQLFFLHVPEGKLVTTLL